MTWVCDKCYSAMDVTHVRRDRNRVHCPVCGTEWYVDDDDEYINDGSGTYDCDDDDEEECDGESLSVYEAAIIWASRGKDEDYMFGYSEDELEDALS